MVKTVKRARRCDSTPEPSPPEVAEPMIIFACLSLKRRVLVALPSSFDEAIILARSTFKLENTVSVTLGIRYKGSEVELASSSWAVVKFDSEISIVVGLSVSVGDRGGDQIRSDTIAKLMAQDQEPKWRVRVKRELAFSSNVMC